MISVPDLEPVIVLQWNLYTYIPNKGVGVGVLGGGGGGVLGVVLGGGGGGGGGDPRNISRKYRNFPWGIRLFFRDFLFIHNYYHVLRSFFQFQVNDIHISNIRSTILWNKWNNTNRKWELLCCICK